MYHMLTSMSFRQLLLQQAPVFAVSFLIAELFYKFHSFALECLAFLLTWAAIDFLVETAVKVIRKLSRQHRRADRHSPYGGARDVK